MKKLIMLALVLCFAMPVSSRHRTTPGIVIEVHGKTPYETGRLKSLSDRLNFDGQPMPRWWRIVVLDKVDWDNDLATYKLSGVTDSAFSILGPNITFVNEDYLTSVSDKRIEHTLAHEAGHLICSCHNEDTANRIAEKLER